MLRRIVSGGQTGVDRAALDVALRCGLEIGGWCPRGRLAEDGVISPFYPLDETPSVDYAERTDWNVRDSDGTLVLCGGAPTGGTAYTIACAKMRGKPILILDVKRGPSIAMVTAWIAAERIASLNVAGPRESTWPGIYALASPFLTSLFSAYG